MIRCKLFQLWFRIDGTPARALGQSSAGGHLQRCPTCRAYCRQMERLDEQLQSSPAKTLSDAACSRIEAATLNRLRQADPLQMQPQRAVPIARQPFRSGLWAAAAMLMVAVLLFVAHQRTGQEPIQEPPALTSMQDELDTAYLTGQLSRLTTLPENPLQAEVTRLTGDARRAVMFLVNCAPSNPLASIDNEL